MKLKFTFQRRPRMRIQIPLHSGRAEPKESFQKYSLTTLVFQSARLNQKDFFSNRNSHNRKRNNLEPEKAGKQVLVKQFLK